jgi:aminopeptidase N
MSTYLVALIISDFECLSEKVENLGEKGFVDVSVCGRADAVNDGQLDYALDVAIKVIKFFEEFYKVKYPLSKCGMF